jgi:hypothetical protein
MDRYNGFNYGSRTKLLHWISDRNISDSDDWALHRTKYSADGDADACTDDGCYYCAVGCCSINTRTCDKYYACDCVLRE